MPKLFLPACALLLSATAALAQGPAALLKLPLPPADQTLHYGTDPLQIAELRLPKSKGPLPVVIVVTAAAGQTTSPAPTHSPMLPS